MVEVNQAVSMYRNHKGDFYDEIKDLNEKFVELGINCEVIQKVTDDGEELIFRKIDL